MSDKRKENIHVTPDGDEGWVNQSQGKELSRHRTKEEAEEAGREEAKEAHTELKIHKKDGVISESHSYGNDPFPPRG
ncbi:DUF2188 domain-containing protein [Paenibacillus spiritus]|uniref:DUF2188 domain-containing protein n=1 Tax=Paenibacillus spiritus TaxID=2496557 RepID=A0A5J5GE35_9BACL|nr:MULTISPECIES: DUF2188 domain-containing protein [Paenibacillus]KAA9006466.1 DUF2188 domain-containing protein [Paenibacillus spiritus]